MMESLVFTITYVNVTFLIGRLFIILFILFLFSVTYLMENIKGKNENTFYRLNIFHFVSCFIALKEADTFKLA